MLYTTLHKTTFMMGVIDYAILKDAEYFCEQNNLNLLGEFICEKPASDEVVNFYKEKLN